MTSKLTKQVCVQNTRIQSLEKQVKDLNDLIVKHIGSSVAAPSHVLEFPIFKTKEEYMEAENHPRDMVSPMFLFYFIELEYSIFFLWTCSTDKYTYWIYVF